MSKCQDLEPLFTAYVDDEAAPPDRAHVDEHLHKCPPCRERVSAERFVREVVRARRDELRPCASTALKHRCAAQRAVSAVRGGTVQRSRAWVPLSLAAMLFLTVTGVFVFGINNPAEAFAAQMSLDHKSCFFFNKTRSGPDADVAGREWSVQNGWSLRVPGSTGIQGLVLLGVRRCGSTRGRVAHAMYEWHGRPLSVFVLNELIANAPPSPPGRPATDSYAKLGEHAIIWSRGYRTYAVVAKGDMTEIQQVAAQIRQTTE